MRFELERRDCRLMSITTGSKRQSEINAVLPSYRYNHKLHISLCLTFNSSTPLCAGGSDERLELAIKPQLPTYVPFALV